MADLMPPPGLGTGPSNTAYLQALQNVVLAIQTGSNYSGSIVTQLTNLVTSTNSVATAITNQTSVIRQNFWGPTVSSTGTANVQAVSYSNGPTGYAQGQVFAFIVGAGLYNLGAGNSDTFVNINGLGNVDVLQDGNKLVGGEFQPGSIMILAYDGTNMQIIGGTNSISPPASNILINPSMDIDQANEGAAVNFVTGQISYIVDQWLGQLVSANGTTTACKRDNVNVPFGFNYSFQIKNTNGTALAVGDVVTCRQQIEANNATNIGFGTAAAKTLALRFFVYSTIAPYTFTVVLKNAANNRSYPLVFTVNNATTWEEKFGIIPGDTGGSWVLTGTAESFRITIGVVSGSTFWGTANTWNATNVIGTAANTNTFISTTNAIFQISGVQLCVSDVITPFVRRPFTEELALCQRYYEKSYDYGVPLGSVSLPGRDGQVTAQAATAGLTPVLPIRFKTPKRATPTISIWSPGAGTANNVTYNAADLAGATAGNIGLNGCNLGANAAAGVVNSNWSAHWSADCRL